jgi:hypothetical protein
MADANQANDPHDEILDGVEIRFTSHDPRPVIPARSLNDWERALIGRILSMHVEGQEAALAQASSARVEAECSHCPSVWLRVNDAESNLIGEGGEPFQGVAPCEIHGRDADGMPFQILLHIDHGVLTEVDAFRGDGQSFLRLPDPEASELVCP